MSRYLAARQRVDTGLARLILRRRGVSIGNGVIFQGMPLVTLVAGSRILLGRNTVVCSDGRDTALGVSHSVTLRTLEAAAVIEIGDSCGLSGTSIVAADRITLGDRVLVGSDVLICDTDFHPVDQGCGRRFALRSTPRPDGGDSVSIGSDVFIGARSLVLKGVSVGAETVIGAGSVVTRSIPAGVVAVGNPCVPIRRLRH